MPLPFSVDSLDSVDESMRGLYKESDGKYQIAIEGLPQDNSAEYESRITKMDAKINELLGEKKAESEKRKEAEEAARKEAEEAARKSGDVEALEKSWSDKLQKQLSDLQNKYEPELEGTKKLLEKATVDATASQIAAEIGVSGTQKALLPHIRMRLKMAVKDGEARTVVTDINGKPSANTLEDLKQEFVNDPAFAPLIIGSKASGGGAASSDGGAGTSSIKRADFDTKSPIEKAEFIKGGGIVSD
jgi:hypothetical protein